MRERQACGNRGAAMNRLKRQMVAAMLAHLDGNPPRPPFAGLHLWQVFAALSEVRRWGPNGPDPIPPTEVEAWARGRGITLPAHHLRIIDALDAAWLDHARKAPGERVDGVMTGEVFDAMFG